VRGEIGVEEILRGCAINRIWKPFEVMASLLDVLHLNRN
jgi:hypothetical protein